MLVLMTNLHPQALQLDLLVKRQFHAFTSDVYIDAINLLISAGNNSDFSNYQELWFPHQSYRMAVPVAITTGAGAGGVPGSVGSAITVPACPQDPAAQINTFKSYVTFIADPSPGS